MSSLVHEIDRDPPKTTKELLDIATRHASSEEAVGAGFVLGNMKTAVSSSRAAPSKATVKSTRKGAKGGKKGQKWHPRCVAIMASDDNDEEKADDSGKEYVMAVKHDFKHKTWQQKDHFKKLHKATRPNHSYLVKHKLKDCTVMKNFMTSVALLKCRKLEGDPGGKDATPIPEEVEVMTIFG
jgi:hypothetical protein